MKPWQHDGGPDSAHDLGLMRHPTFQSQEHKRLYAELTTKRAWQLVHAGHHDVDHAFLTAMAFEAATCSFWETLEQHDPKGWPK